MKKLIVAKTFSLDTDEALLDALINHLKNSDLPYRTEKQDQDVQLLIYHSEHLQEVNLFIHEYVNKDVTETLPSKLQKRVYQCLRALCSDPVCLFCISVSTACFFLYFLEERYLLSFLSFQEFNSINFQSSLSAFDAMINILHEFEVWRLFTPVFLHFTWHNLLFNVVVFYYLGVQIERKEGAISLIITLLFLAMISNLSQFYLFPTTLFGGLTGVIFGLLAYCWLSNRYRQNNGYRLSPILVMLVLFTIFIGCLRLYGIDWIYSAHFGPFIAGCVMVFFRRHITR